MPIFNRDNRFNRKIENEGQKHSKQTLILSAISESVAVTEFDYYDWQWIQCIKKFVKWFVVILLNQQIDYFNTAKVAYKCSNIDDQKSIYS